MEDSKKELITNKLESCNDILKYCEKTSNDLTIETNQILQNLHLKNFKALVIKVIISNIKYRDLNEVKLGMPMNMNEQSILDLFSDLIDEKIINIEFNYSGDKLLIHSFDVKWLNTDLLINSLLKIIVI